MATRSLARTVIEGGRRNYNKFERRLTIRQERRRARIFSRVVRSDPEQFDGGSIELRRRVRKEFNDRLSPAYRWLYAHDGQRWNDVRSAMFRLADTRTTKGWHLIFGHMISAVSMRADHRFNSRYGHWYDDLFIDGGLLCHEPFPFKKYRRERSAKEYDPELSAWLRGRRIVCQDKMLYWALPSIHMVKGYRGYRLRTVTGYRQDRPFDERERLIFHALSKKVQQELLDGSYWMGR